MLWFFGFFAPAALADDNTGDANEVEIAAALPLTGDEYTFGRGSLEGLQLAIEEANASGQGPRLKLVNYDDASDDARAKDIADKIVASPAALVLGPTLSSASLAAGPVYAAAGVVSLTTTATSDLITSNPTTFRIVFKNSDQGELLAAYASRILHSDAASVVWIDSGYGRSLREGFARGADRFGLQVNYFNIAGPADVDAVLPRLSSVPGQPPVVLLTLDAEGAGLVAGLRRAGFSGPILGNDSFGDESFSGRLNGLPEEKANPGALTDGVMGLSPMILDSANADVLAFAERFRARFKHDPVWFSTAGFDAAHAAIEAIRASVKTAGADRDRLRKAVFDYLDQLRDPNQGLPGLMGPIWFDADHGRQVGIRIGRFSRNRFESAPVQLVPTTNPDAAELTSGAVFELAPGRFVRRQRVVYTGVFLNEVSRIDLPQSRFTADMYVWLRYAAKESGADPTAIDFPDLVRGSSDGKQSAAETTLDDGTTYRLWRLRGDFKNEFDLHRYPADQQTLTIRLFNAEGASDRVVYVQDRRSQPPPGLPDATSNRFGGLASDNAFRDLTQWTPLAVSAARDTLVTNSALGDPRLVGLQRVRELSGFSVNVEVRRRVIATLIKTLLPLVLMAMIMYATLHFPAVLIKEKVTVAVTSALTGAVLLSSINAQLGVVGYVMAVEYVFYIFFGLCLFAIVTALAGERFRNVGRPASAVAVENAGQALFVVALLGITSVTGYVLWR
jgi:ABC-type branched-subunit amino acid transport system substrate-binding protein